MFNLRITRNSLVLILFLVIFNSCGTNLNSVAHNAVDILGLASSETTSPLQKIDWQKYQPRNFLLNKMEAELVTLSGIPETSLALSYDQSGKLYLWNTKTLKAQELCKLEGHASSAAFESNYGLVALSLKSNMKIFSISDCKSLFSLTRVRSRSANMEFHPNGESLLIGGLDSRVYHWSFLKDLPNSPVKERNLSLERYFSHISSITAVANHPTGRVFFSGDSDGYLNVWKYYQADAYQGQYDVNRQFGIRGYSERAFKALQRIKTADSIEKIVIANAGRFVVTTSQSGQVEIRKVRGFKLVADFVAHAGLIYDLVVFSSDDSNSISLATLGRDNLLKLWTVRLDPNSVEPASISEDRSVKIEDARILLITNNNDLLYGTSDGKLNAIVWTASGI